MTRASAFATVALALVVLPLLRAEAKYTGEVGDDAWIKNPINAEIDYTYTLTGSIRDASGAMLTPAGSYAAQHIKIQFSVAKDMNPPTIAHVAGWNPSSQRSRICVPGADARREKRCSRSARSNIHARARERRNSSTSALTSAGSSNSTIFPFRIVNTCTHRKSTSLPLPFGPSRLVPSTTTLSPCARTSAG